MKDIGLFFGSFNPIHLGHLKIAEAFLEKTTLDEIWFVVSPHNPLKDKESLLQAQLRLDLVKKVLSGKPKLKVCDIEYQLEQPSYTVNTLQALTEKYPSHYFTLLFGSDSIDSFRKWKNHREILENYPIKVYPRKKDYTLNEYFKAYAIEIIHLPLLPVSSTQIRNYLQQNKSIKELVPPEVSSFFEREKNKSF
jgi:nicotinate-nucleotide adenylyltransferase